ncbi:MAG: c-type cytochrome, partial [Verrucomicrobiota bacterium]
ALQRLPMEARWPIASALSRHEEDNDDHNIPKMIWFGFEPMVPENPTRALNLAAESAMPILQEWTARRAAEADERALTSLSSALGRKNLAPPVQLAFLKGMRNGLEGRTDLTAPSNWKKAYDLLAGSKDKTVARLSTELSQQFGDTEAAMKMIAVLENGQADPNSRRDSLKQLAAQQHPELKKRLSKLLNDDALRTEAIRATAAFEGDQLAEQLLKGYDQLSTDDQLEAVQAMASRSKSGWKLTEAIKSKRIPKKDVPAYVARQLRRVVGNGFVEVWGPIDQLPADKEKAMAKYRGLLTNDALSKANAAHGKTIFAKTCSSCHQLYGTGGEIGPDLTGSNRTNLDYILDNMINPSGVIQDDYKLVIITTRDGRTLAGNVANETERQVTLRMVGQEAVINKSAIQSREVVPVSLMPEGMLQSLSDKEVLDLVAYLKTSEDTK